MSTLEKIAFTIGFSLVVIFLSMDLTTEQNIWLAAFAFGLIACTVFRIFDVMEDRQLDRKYGNEK